MLTRWIPALATISALSACSMPGAHKPVLAPTQPCKPSCVTTKSCAVLDDRLVDARRPMLACIRKAAGAGALHRAHRCYRALRVLESARWWLRTLNAEDPALPTIYREPVRSVRLEFLCRIERLSVARTPEAIQRRYLEMIRSYP